MAIDKKIKIDLSNLPRKGRGVDWYNSIGLKIPFNYDDIAGELQVIDYTRDGKYALGGVTLRYNNKEKTIPLSSLHKGNFTKFITSNTILDSNIKTFYPKYKIGEEIHYKHNDNSKETIYEVLDVKYNNGKYQKYVVTYTLKCKECGVIIEREQPYIFGCPCCSKARSVFRGYNDIPTTDPWMIPFFSGGEEEAVNYTANSAKKIYPVCPICGKQSDKLSRIINLKNNKSFKCKYCSSGISFPERFFIAFLKQIGCEYVFQAYEKDVGFKCDKKIYDFYIPDYSCIVETNGSQHYSGYWMNPYICDIKQNDITKKNFAINGGIKNYIELNCSKTSLSWLKYEILNSKLCDIFDLNNREIDWIECIESATNNLTKEICIDYENNYLDINELIEKYHIGSHGIINALKRGNEIGWCNYIPNQINYSPIDVFYCGEYIFSDICASKVAEVLVDKYAVNVNKGIINNRIRNKTDVDGFTFTRITDPKRKREVIRNDS